MTYAYISGLNTVTWTYSRHIGEVNQSKTRRFYPSVCLINATACSTHTILRINDFFQGVRAGESSPIVGTVWAHYPDNRLFIRDLECRTRSEIWWVLALLEASQPLIGHYVYMKIRTGF